MAPNPFTFDYLKQQYQAVLDAEFGTDQPAQAIRHHQVKTWAKRQRKAL